MYGARLIGYYNHKATLSNAIDDYKQMTGILPKMIEDVTTTNAALGQFVQKYRIRYLPCESANTYMILSSYEHHLNNKLRRIRLLRVTGVGIVVISSFISVCLKLTTRKPDEYAKMWSMRVVEGAIWLLN